MRQSCNGSVIGLFVFTSALCCATPKPAQDVSYGNLPLSFEQNQGQADRHVRFLSRGSGYSIFLTGSEAVLAMGNGAKSEVLRLQLTHAKPGIGITGVERLPGTANYFVGNDPSKWHVGVATYGKVKYANVYDGVDLVYYGNQNQLEYDFVIAPGANVSPIRLRFDGANGLHLEHGGDLRVTGNNGDVSFRKPLLYQEIAGHRHAVDGSFKILARNTVGFAVGKYDSSKELVIDPTLTYSTFLSGSGGEVGTAIAADSAGNAYVVGKTYSTDFPVAAGALQSSFGTSGNNYNAFLAKLNPAGTGLVFATYLGGNANVATLGNYNNGDYPYALSVDSSGNSYITGATYSTNFPVTSGAFQSSNKAAATGGPNCFVSKVNANGTQLIYSTYLGGSKGDGCSHVAVDATGNAYLTGEATSFDFPTSGGVLQINNAAASTGGSNAFVTKLNPTGAVLVYSTFLGGTGSDLGAGIAVDAAGYAYIGGATYSSDFPVTAGAFQTANQGVTNKFSNGFIAKLNPSASALIYSTYLGGTGNVNGASGNNNGDLLESIAVDASGDAYVSGLTSSNDFPVSGGAFQTINQSFGPNGPPTLFVTKLNSFGTGLIFSTYLGSSLGAGNEGSTGSMAVDGNGNVYLAGYTFGTDFPVTSNAFQSSNHCSPNTGTNAFLTELNATGSGLVYSTYLGGSGLTVVIPIAGSNSETVTTCVDAAYGVALDTAGNAYVTGTSTSKDFPVTPGAFQTQTNATGPAFVAKFALGTTRSATVTFSADANPQVAGTNVTFTDTIQSTGGGPTPTGTVTFDVDGTAVATVTLNTSGHATYSTNVLSPGSHTITALYSGDATYSANSSTLTESITGNVSVAFNTSPAGLQYSVDGITYNAAQTLSLLNGSQHTISVPSGVQGSNGTQYTFATWSSVGSTPTQTITAKAGTFYTAMFSTSYLLTTLVTPVQGGNLSVLPSNGPYFPAGSQVSLLATANTGYAFNSWTGGVATPLAPSTTILMNGPQNVTASFVPSGPAVLYSNIILKAGLKVDTSILWGFVIGNSGTGVAMGAQIDSLSLVQTGGPACTPIVLSTFPLSAGNILPGTVSMADVLFNFHSCSPISRFTVTVSFSANAGAATGSLVRYNQFY